ncbi:MAG: hypothetical protein ABSA70_09610 [Terriglobia bacterium]
MNIIGTRAVVPFHPGLKAMNKGRGLALIQRKRREWYMRFSVGSRPELNSRCHIPAKHVAQDSRFNPAAFSR